ncbi:MAG: PIG-L deacetylase family protein [Anaerolineaceae bacterium]|nr:PIG-L deacetylase family protein [Anaerolineaceae bacterium]
MTDQPFYIPESAMAIVAHPDDIEFSCVGTLARWVKSGTKVSYVLCTSGDVGIATPGMTRERAAEIREKEARSAAKIAGAIEINFLREPDGLLQPTLELRKKLVREIRRFKPEVVFTGDPTVVFASEYYINHPDHRAAATAALDAVFPAAGQPNLFQELEEEGLTAHKVRKVYITGQQQTDIFISIDDTIEIKLAALRAHKSQFPNWDPGERVKQWAAERAKDKGMQYAEAFRVITLEDDETWERLRHSQNGVA